MPADKETIDAVNGLIEELKAALGEEAMKRQSVRRGLVIDTLFYLPTAAARREGIQTLAGLLNDLRGILGEQFVKLGSVRRAMAIIGGKAWEDAENFRKEVEARELQESLATKH